MNNTSTFLRISALALAGLTSLGACTGARITQETNEQIKRAQDRSESVKPVFTPDPQSAWRGTQAHAEQRAANQRSAQVLRKTQKSWVGSVMVPVNAEDKLPTLFSQDYTLNFSDKTRKADIATVAARLSQLVGIPVRIQPDVYGAAPEQKAPAANAERQDSDSATSLSITAETPKSGGSVTGATALNIHAIDMKWSGSLKDFLDHLTDRLGLSWAYRDNSIVIMRFTTEVYELASYPSAYEYALSSGTSGQMNTAGGGAGGGGMGGGMGGGGQGAGRGFRSTTQLNIAEQGKVEGVSGILNVVRKMIAGVPGSEAYLTDGSGRLMVKSNRDMQTQVREFIRAENTNMLKQVHIQLDVYSVTLSQDNEVGVDWSIFYNRLTRNSGVSVLSPGSLVGNAAGSVTFRAADGSFTRKDPALFGTPQYEDPLFALRSTSIISALNEIGRNVQHRPVSMIALNRQWARKARLTSTGYLSETVPATSGALGGVASLPGLRTDTVTTGDQFAVMPYVLDSNTVMLKFGISLSDLLGLFDVTSGSGVNLQRVQTPNTSTLSDQFTVALRPGEIMAITGLSRELSAAQQRTLAEEAPLFTGGSRKLRKFHEHFVVFLRVVSI